MINFDSKNRIFKLDTPNSSYVIGVVDSDQLVNLYYGSKIADTEGLEARSFRPRCASFSPLTNEHYTDSHDFSPDCAPMEYGCNGCGDFRVSALSIKNADGNTVTDMRYEGHRIYAGKPSAEPLPSVYLNSESEAYTLEIYMADRATDIRVTLIYTVFNALDVIIRSAKIENASQKPADIERAMSLCVDLPSMDYDLITLYGRHAKERSEERARSPTDFRELRASAEFRVTVKTRLRLSSPKMPTRTAARPTASISFTAATSSSAPNATSRAPRAWSWA